MKSLITVLYSMTILLLGQSCLSADETVQLRQSDNKVDVMIDGKPFTTFLYSQDQTKPYFSPVQSPEGVVMTRPVPAPKDDHPHHKGIWISVHKVNGHDFWGERSPIKNQSVKIIEASGNPAKFVATNHWVDENNEPIVTETTQFSIYANRLIAFDIKLTGGKETVLFGDTKEGFLGFRMVDSMREVETGRVVNAEGLKGTKQCWGKCSKWVDYVGDVEGKVVGVTLMDNPSNFRPSRYHVRNYGLFSVSPFGERKYTNGKENARLLELNPGESVELKYGLYIHSGETADADIPKVYASYVENN